MTNSSTSSSKAFKPEISDAELKARIVSPRSGPWYRHVWDIMGTIAAVGLIELTLHIGVAKFGWFVQEEGLTQRSSFVESAVVRAERAEAIDVAIVGSSIADGVDLAGLSAQLGEGAIADTYRLVGADSKGTAQMLDTIVFPNLEAEWVVYIVSPHDVNGLSPVGKRNEQIPSLDAYEQNRFTYKLSRSIEKHLYLYRYRAGIKQSFPSLSKLKRVIKKKPSQSKVAEKPYEFASYEAFEEASRFDADLDYIYQLCEQNNARLLILTLPTNPAVTSEAFQSAATDWVSSLQAFAQANDVNFINGFEFIQSADQFRDTHHLSQEGIADATEAIREEIVQSRSR